MSVAPGTQHHALLNSNEPPDESESSFVWSVALKTEAALTYLDHEIANLRENLKMPPELLREIFSWTLPSNGEALDVGKFDMGQTPWLLTQIAIHYPQSRQTSSTYSPSLMKAHLGYSQGLKIHFYASREMDARPQIDMFKLLSQYSSCWEELSVGLTFDLASTLVALCNQIPSVRRLWIQWSSLEDQMLMQPINCFQTASSLVDIGMGIRGVMHLGKTEDAC
ncbi:hypothetical protein DFH08DRAFT_822237 [Mycena albidolilacea]|uniref:Uncharacterized protein n=1 Tax=Mycena albidolilacea TaxID=1033008 RepID=A0AAD6ZA07_9AGAR|nr:hypothetical protein DFH08DRAFT_822237 [Mycena albidolilacea]